MANETEIKFLVNDVAALESRLRENGFRQQTPSTHELNTLYDLPSGELRGRGEVLRIRQYGDTWSITHKSKGTADRHKIRAEHETRVTDGKQMEAILRALGYTPSFVYEKFRSEWTDGRGHVVVDRTPIGDLGEIEGEGGWIDEVASKLQVPESSYITKSYAVLFVEWRHKTRSDARNMTFEECGIRPPKF